MVRDSRSLKGLKSQLSLKFTVQERKGRNLLTKADAQESFWQLHLLCLLPIPLSNALFLLVICAFLIDDKNREAQMSITQNVFLGTGIFSSCYVSLLEA